MGIGVEHPLREWRKRQLPKLTLDAAAAAVGTVRQVWRDWEIGRNIPSRTYMPRVYAFTKGVITPNDFYDLPPIGQLELPMMEPVAAPLFDVRAAEGSEQPQLQAAA
jgi:hypothetical protein